jgi:4-hydroxy-tetrahydrodipicolinate synthase
MAGRFGSVLTAMATPFESDGGLDLEGARVLAEHLFAHGTDAIVVGGTTGESPTLDHEEKETLFEAVVGIAHGLGKQAVCGTGTNNTRESIHLTRMAEELGADGVLVVTPYYNKPPQRALVQHFRMVAESAPKLPLIAYNIPGRTGTRIEHETLLKMAQVPNIVAVKDSTGDVEGVRKLVAEAPDGFEVYSGDDWATFEFMQAGAVGVVSVASHVVGDQLAEMVRALEAGDVAAASSINDRLKPVFDALFCTTSPIPLKAALEMLGLPGGPLRPPLFSATDEERATVEQALKDADVL